ncbi:MAG: hypothetical protein HQM16_09710 [Deltaproteobacteria bacterium]|nr:hypothetical protein [Deltaproteobacteria bacterium]
MRIIIYIITLSIIVLLGFSVHAKSGEVTVPLKELDRLIAISAHVDEDAPVLIKPSEIRERSCYCACQPSLSGYEENIWICTSKLCPEFEKKCTVSFREKEEG